VKDFRNGFDDGSVLDAQRALANGARNRGDREDGVREVGHASSPGDREGSGEQRSIAATGAGAASERVAVLRVRKDEDGEPPRGADE